MRCLFHVTDCVLHGHDVGKPEKRGLQDQVGVVAKTQLPGNSVCVHNVELHIVICNIILDIAGQLLIQLRLSPRSIQKERAAVLDLMDHVVAGNVGLGVAGQKIRRLNEICGTDRIL
ncbi:hypothetical protein SDC9_107670 [bioreactor metagenome]|uniref:Uncharacterized protein n=1 Tax=bioreactor metagenome TaxID=1076179 RepID=A0A645B6Y2_9ZZZZ